MFSCKVWEKLEYANPVNAGTGGLDESTTEADKSACLNNEDYAREINVILDASLAERGTVMAEYYL